MWYYKYRVKRDTKEGVKMKKLFQSREFFDGSIVIVARVFLYEVVDDECYKIVIHSPKTHIEHVVNGSYNSATWKFQNACDKLHVAVEA